VAIYYRGDFGGQLKIQARNVLGGGRGPGGERGRQNKAKECLKGFKARFFIF
jgi:hypothetical protein